MQNKLPDEEYSMLAIVGLSSSIIENICEELQKEGHSIYAANYNYSEQTVVSGNKKSINSAINIFKENGAKRVIELKTSGPFHTKLLSNAKEEYKKELEKVNFNRNSQTKVIKNIDGSFYNNTDDFVDILSRHIISPVRLDKAIEIMNKEKIDTYVEIGPGKTLTGFIRKENKDANVINIFDVDSLKNAINILRKGDL